jgi:hypothetical protein
MHLDELKGIHQGETVWVFGSGSSLNFLSPQFFDDKVCVTANFAAKTFGLRSYYAYSNYHNIDVQSFGAGLIAAVMLAKDTLTQKPWPGEVPDNVALSEAHNYHPPGSAWDPYKMPPPEGQVVYGSSSIHGATHLAAHLGAKHIVMVGADAGLIDGDVNVKEYVIPTQQFSLNVWNRHSGILKQWLAERYGVTIYSLNPFINLNLEGHKFEGVS